MHPHFSLMLVEIGTALTMSLTYEATFVMDIQIHKIEESIYDPFGHPWIRNGLKLIQS